MKPRLPIIRLSRDDAALAFKHWFCATQDGFPAVLEHRFQPDGSASVIVVGLGTETPTRKILAAPQVGQSIQLWLDYERPGERLGLVEFLRTATVPWRARLAQSGAPGVGLRPRLHTRLASRSVSRQ